MNIFWQDIVGHGQLIKRLRRAIVRDRLPHALIFYGEAGIGKKKVARVLAATLLCDEAAKTGVPCGECQSCRLMKAGTHPDFGEIFPEGGVALRSIKIDKVRQLRRDASRYPTLAKSRVFIIDDAHLMNESAQNALLKTIEEPPGNVYFIFVTDSPGGLLDTVVSRCTGVKFFPLAATDVERILREGSDFTSDDAKRLAAVAGGSVEMALHLGAADGIALIADAEQFLANLPQADRQMLLAKGEALAKNPKERVRDWLSALNVFLHDLLVIACGGQGQRSAAEEEKMRALAAHFTKERLFAMQAIVAESMVRILANVNMRLFAESVLIRLARC